MLAYILFSSANEMYFLSSAMIGTGTGRDPMLFLVFVLLVVTEQFSKSRSDTFHDSVSPRLRPVPNARRILIRSAGYGSDAVSISCIWVWVRDMTGLSSSFTDSAQFRHSDIDSSCTNEWKPASSLCPPYWVSTALSPCLYQVWTCQWCFGWSA